MKDNYYVDNVKMLEVLKQYRDALTLSDKARIPEYFGECVLQISNRLSYKSNFVNYTYREEMVGDAIENCIRCVSSFDTTKYSNPFSYFTQVIYYAFLRRIAKEKKQSYIKSKLVNNMPFDSFDMQEQDDDAEFKSSFMAFIQMHQNFDDSFMKKKDKEPKQKSSLSEFLDDITLEEILDVE